MIIGLDFRLTDVSEIKGIAKCLLNFEFGDFESCSFNCSTNQSGGLLSVSILNDDIDVQSLLNGSFTVTVISQKKSFDVLCEGTTFVDLTTTSESLQLNPFVNLSSMNFGLLGVNKVKLDMLYRNKGPTRIKAGAIEIVISILDLSQLSHDPLESHLHCALSDKSDSVNVKSVLLSICCL